MRKVIEDNVILKSCCFEELFDLSDVKIIGNFDCSINYLKNLAGSPKHVTGDFICSNNQLSSLNGAPLIVDGDFLCNDNQLSNLVGAPQYVGADFNCKGNNLQSLEGIPKIIKGRFIINDELIKRWGRKYIQSLSDIQGRIDNRMSGWFDAGHFETPEDRDFE